MAITESTVIYEYEEILLGKKSSFLSCLGDDEKNGSMSVVPMKEIKRRIGYVWRYAIENLLGWTPQQALVYITDDIVKQLCLDKTLKKIGFNFKKEYAGHYEFVLQYAFPNEIRFDVREQAISEWERWRHGDRSGHWKNKKQKYKYPKNFFSDIYGIDRANYLMKHVVGMYLSDKSLKDQYLFFADKKDSRKFLSKHNLAKPIGIVYNTPLDYFHNALSPFERDNFLYYSLKLRDEYDKANEKTA